MLEIKFRAKTESGYWQNGSVIHITEIYSGEEDWEECDIWELVTGDGANFNIQKETIGQFTRTT